MCVYCFDKPVALVTCFWRNSQHWSRISFGCNFSTHVNDTHLFVALNDDRIEETVSFKKKMSQDFLRQVLITTFPSAHEADHYSTARFHECDTWLSFALCHRSNEHVIRLEFRQSIRRLVHHDPSVRRTSSATRNTDRAPISEWNVSRAVCHSRSVCVWFRSTLCSCSFRLTRSVKLSGLICIGDCSFDHQLKLLEPHVCRHHRCRRLPHPRHLPHSLQPSQSLLRGGIPFARVMCRWE